MICLVIVLCCFVLMPLDDGYILRKIALWVVIILALCAVGYSQTVPPAPQITSSSSAVGQSTINANYPQCGSAVTSCGGLADCSCWVQLWRAQCPAGSCPTPSTATYTQLPNPTVTNWGNETSTGITGMVWNDTDPALVAGSTWAYFVTSNYAKYTPFTTSPPSNQAKLTIGGTATTVWFSVYIDFDNPNCVTGNTCTANLYRALGPSCPSWPSSSWVQLPQKDATGASYVTSTVSASNTHFKFKDDGQRPNNLGYAKSYCYAATNTYVANPSSEGKPSSALPVTTPLVHQATLNWSSASCRTASPCTLQVYRAQCASATSCPAYPGTAWSALNMTSGLTTNQTAQGTSWKYLDTDAALKSTTTYAWVAVNKYTNGTTVSSASSAFIGTTKTATTRRQHAQTSAHSGSRPTVTIRPN